MSAVATATAVDTVPQTVSVKADLPPSNETQKNDPTPIHGDWRDDLARDGYAIVKGAIPRERADKYADAMYSWLEGL